MSHLVLNGISKRFGGLVAVNNVSFGVKAASVCSVIGPNGAGKTTLFNIITGVLRPDKGSVLFNGGDITGKNPTRIARAGICRTFQNIRLFRHLSALENVMIGATSTLGGSISDQLPRPWRRSSPLKHLVEEAKSWLEWVGFTSDQDRLPHELPYGDQRRIEIARALATKPNLLILDEPTAGMVAQEARHVIELIHRLRERKVTVLLIEHNMNVIMSASDSIVVLNFGEKLAEGPPSIVRSDRRVIEAYLGVDE